VYKVLATHPDNAMNDEQKINAAESTDNPPDAANQEQAKPLTVEDVHAATLPLHLDPAHVARANAAASGSKPTEADPVSIPNEDGGGQAGEDALDD
jgi:hypothetical protein